MKRFVLQRFLVLWLALFSVPGWTTAFGSMDDAISHYRQMARGGQWATLSGQFLLRPGQQHEQVVAVREKLVRLGDYAVDESVSEPDRYDDALAESVLRFQRRHGLKPDAIIGPETRDALNVSPRERLRQLRLNQQRTLEAAAVGDGEFIEINIPEYRLRYFRDNALLTEMKVIVGRPERQTPLLSSVVSAIEVNPDWNIPRKIAVEDILPKLKKTSLDALGLRLVKGWTEPPKVVEEEQLATNLESFYRGELRDQYRLWQPPGEQNPLGRLKFIFPNDGSIYMHDTPARNLFQESRRAFSSGCIRLENPRELAEILFETETRRSETFSLDMKLEKESARITSLTKKVPVVTRYRTAWVEPESGQVQFRLDIYKRDTEAITRRLISEYVDVNDPLLN